MIKKYLILLEIVLLAISCLAQENDCFIEINGKVINTAGKTISDVEITVKSSKDFFIQLYSKTDGTFSIDSIPKYHDCAIFAAHKVFYTNMIGLGKLKTDTSLTIILDSLKTSKLYCPYFTFTKNCSKINRNQLDCLKLLVNTLFENPTIKLKIIGNQDNAEYSKIGLKRAMKIKKYLIRAGINKNRIIATSQNNCGCATTSYCAKGEIIK